MDLPLRLGGQHVSQYQPNRTHKCVTPPRLQRLPIECTDRDAAFVLDGLLYNESELEVEEHCTDTHGSTEINFAAFAMLGSRFRGVQHQRI